MIIPAKLRILVVDDNAYARVISAQNLRRLGVQDIAEASGGAEAILLLLRQEFDLLLMDWYMPDVSGAGLLHILRDDRFGHASQMPVIMMTAYASRENVERAKTLGVNEVLPKPFTAEQLGAALRRALLNSNEMKTSDPVLLLD